MLPNTRYTPDMETVLILCLICLLAAPVILAGGMALTGIAVAIAAVVAVARVVAHVVLEIFAPLWHPIHRWLNNRFSPVRRRHPRPAAWHQWR